MSIFTFLGEVLGTATRLPPGSKRIVEGVAIEDIAALDMLQAGWARVRANKGGAGGDGVSIDQFGGKLERNLIELSEQLLNGRYRPRSLRRTAIPKEGGAKRWLSIPSVVDRIAQSATLETLTPYLEPRMSEASWAYRPGRGVADAVAAVEAAFAEGYVWTVDADIARYFDRVPHRRLTDELTIWVDDERVINLFARWLRGFARGGRGIAQGSPISPLLANLYLHPIDRLIKAEGYPIVRYADDLVVLTQSEAQAREAHQLLGELLAARGLSLNATKTTVRGPDERFRFLGTDLQARDAATVRDQN